MQLPHSRPTQLFSLFFGVLGFVLLSLATAWSTNLQAGGQKQPPFTASLPTINFGTISVGSSSSQTETLTNATKGSLTIYETSTDGAGFTTTGLTPPVTISPGQSYTFTVTFAPQASGAVSGTMKVGSRNWKSMFSVPLSGTGAAAGALSVTPTSESFGNVTVGSSSTLSGTLTASGASVTISGATSSNSEFSLSGVSFPLTLSEGKSTTFSVIFTPGATGSVSGTLSFTSNANSATQSLSGTGVSAPQHSISLLWDASTSVVNGYNVYRGSQSGGPYTRMNSSLDSLTSYTDGSVVSGTSYYYVTTAVDSSGMESAYSNEVKATVPTP